MIGAVPGVEQSSVNGYKGVIKLRLEGAVSVSINDLQGRWVCYRYMVGRYAYKRPCEVTNVSGERNAFKLAHYRISGVVRGRLLSDDLDWQPNQARRRRTWQGKVQGCDAG